MNEELNQNQVNENDLPSIRKGLLWFFVITSALHMFTQASTMYMMYDPWIGVVTILLECLGLASLILIINKKKIGVHLLACFLLAHFPMNIAIDCVDWSPIIISVVIRAIILGIIIFVPFSGRSVWDVLCKQKGV